MNLKEGEKFPDFELSDDTGKTVSLADLKGKKAVIYFYPKDNTPGCTKEACSFRDNIAEFQRLGIPVIGISADSVESHVKFKEKYSLPFTLLSDKSKGLIEKLGIKSMFGGASRVTFIVDEKGVVLKIFPKVSPDKHAGEVLDFLRNASG